MTPYRTVQEESSNHRLAVQEFDKSVRTAHNGHILRRRRHQVRMRQRHMTCTYRSGPQSPGKSGTVLQFEEIFELLEISIGP